MVSDAPQSQQWWGRLAQGGEGSWWFCADLGKTALNERPRRPLQSLQGPLQAVGSTEPGDLSGRLRLFQAHCKDASQMPTWIEELRGGGGEWDRKATVPPPDNACHCNSWGAFAGWFLQISRNRKHRICVCFHLTFSLSFSSGAAQMAPVVKESACQSRRCRRHRFDLWVGKIP